MKKPQQPHDACRYFFQSLMQNQCGICWNLFSDRSQREFIGWTLKDLYAQNPRAAKAAKLGAPEVKLMFESNNLDLIIRFWRRFARQSRAVEFGRYAYFDTVENNGRSAVVEALLRYDNGQEERVRLTMVSERGGWRFAYLESGLPF